MCRFIVMKYIFLFAILFFTGCLSTVPLVPTKVSKEKSGIITRQEYIPVIDDANKHISTAVKKVPIHVKLYHMPSARPNRLAMRENWSQPPHIYEYDMAEERYEREIQGGSIDLPNSMNIIDYIHSNINRPSDFQSDQSPDPFISF